MGNQVKTTKSDEYPSKNTQNNNEHLGERCYK